MLDRCSGGPPAPTYSFTFGLFLWSSVLPHMMLLRCTRFCIILRVLENTKGCSCYLQAHFLFVSGYLFHFSNSCRSTPQEPILILSDTLQTFISLSNFKEPISFLNGISSIQKIFPTFPFI